MATIIDASASAIRQVDCERPLYSIVLARVGQVSVSIAAELDRVTSAEAGP